MFVRSCVSFLLTLLVFLSLCMYRFDSLAHIVDLYTVISTAIDGTSSYQTNTDEPPLVLGAKMDWQYIISNYTNQRVREEIFHMDQEVRATK
jgi:hypothetical protein